MKKLFLIVILIYSCFVSKAQTIDETKDDRIEAIAESENAEKDLSELEEQRAFLIRNPVDFNYASPDELIRSGILDELQVINLCKYRIKFGRLIALEELQVVDGFSNVFISSILPYFRLGQPLVDDKFKLSSLLDKGRHQLIVRGQRTLEKQAGFLPDENGYRAYLGDPWKIFMRYKFTAGKYFSIGITGEKDAGEELFKGTQPGGFDFYSAHLFIRPGRFLQAIAVGDYQLQYGQGLVAWSGLAFGKGAETILIKKQGLGISPYSSASETGFCRGLAASFGRPGRTLDLWLSNRNIDASFFPVDTALLEFEVSAIRETGLHRNYDELRNKGNLQQRIAGLHFGSALMKFKYGYTFQYLDFSDKLFKGDDIYEQFDASGKSFINQSIDYSYIYRNWNFFGEVAVDKEFNIGSINGFIVGTDKKFSVSVLHRRFGKSYHSFTSNPFRESTRANNEIGTYVGWQYIFNKQLKLTGYVDVFEFPWLKYQVNASSSGHEFMSQFTYTPSRTTEIYVRYRFREKEINDPLHSTVMDEVLPNLQNNLRFQVKFKSGSNWIFQSRIEQVKVTNFETLEGWASGSAFFQDVQYKPMGKPFSIALRYSIFQTQNYDTRIYTYEQDMPGSFSIPSLYYGGQRIYAMLRYRIMQGVDCWVRIGRSMYPALETIGSTDDAINDNHRTDFKFQIRWGF